MSKLSYTSVVLLATIVVLSACSAEPTPTPTRAPEPTRVAASPTPAAPPPPTQTASNRGPAAPNLSTITAKVLSIEADPASAASFRVQATILTSAPVDNNLDFLAGMIGKPVTLIAPRPEMTGIANGATIRAQAVYIGDERGGTYHISQIQKTAP